MLIRVTSRRLQAINETLLVKLQRLGVVASGWGYLTKTSAGKGDHVCSGGMFLKNGCGDKPYLNMGRTKHHGRRWHEEDSGNILVFDYSRRSRSRRTKHYEQQHCGRGQHDQLLSRRQHFAMVAKESSSGNINVLNSVLPQQRILKKMGAAESRTHYLPVSNSYQ
jgi:hypothetical protein